MSKDRIRKMMDSLPRPTPEQLAQLDGHGDLLDSQDSSTTEQEIISNSSTANTKTEK